jgi:predicted anti-sigma-YlaC factor YlaD
MSATHPETNLIPYLRGELSDRERVRTAAHLEGCAACRAQADALARTLQVIARQVEELPTPEWAVYRTELRRKLAARATATRRWWQPTIVWGSFAAAGVAAVALLTVVALHRGNPGIQPSIGPLALAEPDVDIMGRTDVGLLRNYPMVERLDMLESDNYDVIEHLDELAPSPQTHEIQHL